MDYSCQGLKTDWKIILGISSTCAALIILGYMCLDTRLANFVLEKADWRFLRSGALSDPPDLLFLFVCTVCIFCWSCRFYLSSKSSSGWALDFLELMGWTLPLAFALKHLLKWMFGQTKTRVWLLHPDQFGFHWFQGGGDLSGFPSGHMAVFTAFMLAIGRYLPGLRPICVGLLILLALTLILTQNHFFSDIVAGVYLGILTDAFTCRGLAFFHHREESAGKPAMPNRDTARQKQ
jgi:membrane-associated phospholipid phosphatase